MLAAAMVAGFVFASSKVTIAVLSRNETATFATPRTPSIELFTMYGHEAQVMLSTAKVIVRSPASAVDAVITEAIRTKMLKLFCMGWCPRGVRWEATAGRDSRRR